MKCHSINYTEEKNSFQRKYLSLVSALGVIDTPFQYGKTAPEQFEAWKGATPLRIIVKARQIVQGIAFLIENEFMTGETVDINGGLYMR